MEFLGDRVLGLIISEKLLVKFPNEKEGIIDKKLSNLVNKKTCALISKKLNLKNLFYSVHLIKNLKDLQKKLAVIV